LIQRSTPFCSSARELPVGGGAGGLHRAVALNGRHGAGAQQSGEQCGDEDRHLAAPQLREGDRVAAAGLLGQALFALPPADLVHWLEQVAVPINGVPGQVEMSIEDEHVRCQLSVVHCQSFMAARHAPVYSEGRTGSSGQLLFPQLITDNDH
jgi:hypothetical protein